jgi:hypothetical protein
MREDLVDPAIMSRIKHATRLMIARIGSNKDAAAFCGVSEGTMTRWGSAQYPDVMPFHVVCALEMRSGVPTMASMLADLSGHTLALSGPGAAAEDVTAHLVGVATTGSEAVAAMAAAAADNVITPNEANDVLAKLGRSIEAATRAGKVVALKAQGGR